MSAFEESWEMLKMGAMPIPSTPNPPSSDSSDMTEEYSHKDLDAEALIDFLVEEFDMDYREAKTMVTHHKSKEMTNNSRIKEMKKPSGPDMGPGPQEPDMSMM